MQFSLPSSSGCPRRLPENVMTLGTLAAAASSMFSRISFSSRSWFSFRFQPSGILPAPGAMVGISPYFCTVGHCV